MSLVKCLTPMDVKFLWAQCVKAVFKIRSETCRTEAQFCQNLYIFIYDKEGKLAGPTQILPVNVRGPALILKTVKGNYNRMEPFLISE